MLKLSRKVLPITLLVGILISAGCVSVIPTVTIAPGSKLLNQHIGELMSREAIALSCNCVNATVEITLTESVTTKAIDSFDVGNSEQYVTLSMTSQYSVNTPATTPNTPKPQTAASLRTSSSFSVSRSDPLNESDLEQWYMQNLLRLHLSRIVATEIQRYQKQQPKITQE